MSAISGTKTSTCLPAASTLAMLCKYTSVLPDPVTPSSKNTLKPTAALIALMAVCCSLEGASASLV